MKVLIYENPFEHGSKITKEVMMYLRGLELTIAEEFEHADEELAKGNIDYAIIHHTSSQEIDFLKRKYPKTKYIAYSGTFGCESACGAPESNFQNMNQSMVSKLLKLYDGVISSPSQSLEVIAELELEKLGK